MVEAAVEGEQVQGLEVGLELEPEPEPVREQASGVEGI